MNSMVLYLQCLPNLSMGTHALSQELLEDSTDAQQWAWSTILTIPIYTTGIPIYTLPIHLRIYSRESLVSCSIPLPIYRGVQFFP